MTGSGRGRRADGQRNIERLITAASSVFETAGINASLDQIAKEAGVANATLYRHFPTRLELLVAAFGARFQQLVDDAQEAGNLPAGEGFRAWSRRLIEHLVSSRGLRDAFLELDPQGDQAEVITHWHTTIRAAALPLLLSAQRAGHIRGDLDYDEVIAVLAALSSMPGRENRSVDGTLSLALHGLTARP